MTRDERKDIASPTFMMASLLQETPHRDYGHALMLVALLYMYRDCDEDAFKRMMVSMALNLERLAPKVDEGRMEEALEMVQVIVDDVRERFA